MIPQWGETEWAEGLDRFGVQLRAGATTAEETARRALDRIAEHDGQVRAFVHVDPERTLDEARRVDALLRDGRDRGPLMGIPVAVKDVFAVDGMPARAGSRLDVSHVIGFEGSLVQRLRAAGAVILGKTRTIEFAAGAHNISHPTPWNPADPEYHRSPGGSSSGSAAAVAAGFCPVAVGSDTGGSVRAPAALCGIVGHKFTAGTVARDGVFPLCPPLDSAGLLTTSAADALSAAQALLGPAGPLPSVGDLRLGVPDAAMLCGLDGSVAAAFDHALARLRAAGARIETLDWPDAEEVDTVARIYSGLVPAALIETLGADLVAAGIDRIDTVAQHRLAGAAAGDPTSIAALTRALADLSARTAKRMASLDALIFPTTPLCAPRLEDLAGTEAAIAFTGRTLGLTRMANAWGMTACSIPIATAAEDLPVGMDVALPGGADLACVALAGALRAAIRPDE